MQTHHTTRQLPFRPPDENGARGIYVVRNVGFVVPHTRYALVATGTMAPRPANETRIIATAPSCEPATEWN
jgi:hypothetical protein